MSGALCPAWCVEDQVTEDGTTEHLGKEMEIAGFAGRTLLVYLDQVGQRAPRVVLDGFATSFALDEATLVARAVDSLIVEAIPRT